MYGERDALPEISMAVRAVDWHEGMFLRPHHLQAAQRYAAQEISLNGKWDLHYNWGIRAVTLDLDALANYRLVVSRLKCRLRDGTLVSVPEDGLLTPLDLKPAFEAGNSHTVFLGVPVLQLGKANRSSEGASEGYRYRLDTQPLEDENTLASSAGFSPACAVASPERSGTTITVMPGTSRLTSPELLTTAAFGIIFVLTPR